MVRLIRHENAVWVVLLSFFMAIPCLSMDDAPDPLQNHLQQANKHITRTPWKSIGPATQALELATTQHNDEAAAEAHIILARAHLSMQQNDKALEHLMTALTLFKSLGLKEKEAKALQGIGIVYEQTGETDKAMRHLQDALQLYEESSNHQQVARVYISMGIHYSRLGNSDKALEYYKKALALQQEFEDPVGLAATLSNIATIHQKREEYNEAIALYKRVLKLNTEVEVGTRAVAIAQNNLGECYLKTGDFKKSEQYLTESLEATQLISALDITVPTLNALVDLKSEQHRYREGLAYARQLIKANERLNEQQSKDRIAAIENSRELQQKENAIRVLQQENRIHQLTIEKSRTSRNFLIFTIILITVLALGLLGLYVSRTRRNRMIQQKNHELQQALDRIEVLTGLLPICSKCKKVRDDKGYWVQVEQFIAEHTKADFSYGICPDCQSAHYGDQKESQ